MMIVQVTALWGLTTLLAAAAVKSGKVSVEWISSSRTCEAGKPLQCSIRMVVDAGWHTYWLNPGEGGMKTSVEWQLPPGWTAGALEHPVPSRFTSGELVNFGYEGTVLFPVTITAPPDFSGAVILRGRVSWLACNDEGCVPGDAEITLDLTNGTPVASADAPAIADAVQKIPRATRPGLRLEVEDKPASWVLHITAPDEKIDDLPQHEVFPLTPQVIDPAAVIRFAGSGEKWSAEVAKCEYATEPVRELTLVLTARDRRKSFELSWRAP